MPKSHVKRDSFEIYLDILKVCRDKGPAVITKIHRAANLSHYESRHRMNFLVDRGYVAKSNDGENDVYSCSESGRQVISDVESNVAIMEIMKEGSVTVRSGYSKQNKN